MNNLFRSGIFPRLSETAGKHLCRDCRISREHFSYGRAIGIIAFFALIMRLMIGASYLNSYDTEWNIMWAVQLGEGFFSAHSHVSALDYPPLYLYPLYFVGRFIELESIGGYPPFRMLAIKLVPCLTDSLTCVVLWKLASKRNKPLGLLAAAFWAINPAAVFNCACWGQTDCVLMFAAALLMLALEEKHVMAAGVLWAAMCSTKLQGLYLTPVVGMEVLTICFGSLHPKQFSFSKIKKPAVMRFVRFMVAAAATLLLIYLPFMIGSGFSQYQSELSFWEKFFKPVTVYSEGLAKYPYATLNADNLFMLFGLNGVKDELTLLPGITVATLGSLFLLTAVALVVVIYIFGKRRSHWLAAFMLMECIFMLTCRQHERYQMLTLVLLMGAVITLADRRLLTLFGLQSMVIFFNQFRVLSGVRENTGWWNYYRGTRGLLRHYMDNVYENGADWLTQRSAYAAWNSALNVILFAAAAVLVIRYFADSSFRQPLLARFVCTEKMNGIHPDPEEENGR